jgi:uncharacterized repeat protein (TIGR01451 family)
MKRYCYFLIASAAVGMLLLFQISYAQQNPNIAEATDSLGFYLKKVVSNTIIPTGATFSYTIYYTFPAGTQNVTITDALPAPLVFHSLSVSSSCGTYSSVTPTPGTNGTVSVTWNFPPNFGGCSGSLTIVVSFPNGTTCNGTTVRNRACLLGTVLLQGKQQKADFCTPFVSTTAQASNPWDIQKQVLNSTYVGGNCPRALNSDTVTYRICVAKTPGTQGQMNLVGGVVTDVLPTGAQYIGASCSGVSVSGNTIIWTVGNLSATQMYNQVCCDITVYYPPSQFPTGSQITNTATLAGQLGSAQQPCSQFTDSASICWQKVLPPPPTTTASLYKWVNTNGQPGCGGYYFVYFCNTGSTTITGATIIDTVPSGLTITSTSPTSSGVTVSTSGNVVTATLPSLNAGQCSWLYIYFTISPSATPNTTITNCAWGQIAGMAPLQSCASFVVQSPAPSACIFKEICSPQPSYSLGQTIRMRLRLQNIGGQAITGATITDNLNPNFQYIGNPTFYTTNVWNTPCNPQNPTAWSPAPSLTVSGQIITISGVTIPATCQSLFWNGCGYYGNTGVPYYWVEFDVKIRDTAGLGNIPNNFMISGGGLPQPIQSNIVLVLVTGNTGFTVDKQVASDTTNWQSSLTTSAGSVVNYSLKMNIPTGSVPLRHVTFVDLLPKDNGSADDKILQACVSRGSQFSLTYNPSYIATPAANGYNNSATTLADANSISTATGAPPNLFPNDCGTAGSWTSGLSAGNKNLGFYFPTAIGSGTGGTVIVPVKVDANAQPGNIACNTFAAGGAVRHYLNSSTFNDVPVGPLESAPVCIMIDTSAKCYRIQLHGAPQPVGIVPTPVGNACKYQITVTVNNPGPAVQGCANSLQGSVSPATFTVPTGNSTLTFTFIDTPPQDKFACIRYGIVDATGACIVCDSVCFDLPPCPQQDTCCPKFEKVEVKCIGQDTLGNMLYSIVASGTIPCKASLIINTTEGTFTPSSFGVGPGNFTISTTFTDTPPLAPGAITVYYTVIGQGVVFCRDSAKIQLPECPTKPRNCCEGWFRGIQSTVKWFSNGAVQINGTATAGPSLIHRFSAAIVSAQLKRWCPIIPPPSSPWQRIFGDITSGWLIPAPGGPQMLTPYSRQVVWEGPIPDSCQNWKSPAQFQLNMLFPAPTGFKCGDTLRFTVRYTFTDCECRTCDTLITYTVVRKKWIIDFPWDNIAVKRTAKNEFSLFIPETEVTSQDSTEPTQASLRILELILPGVRNVDVRSCKGKDDDCDGHADDVAVKITEGGCVVILPSGKNLPYRFIITSEGLPDTTKTLIGILTWDETDIRTGTSESVSQERTFTIPPLQTGPQPQFNIVQDRESKPAHVRTFSLALVNGEQPAENIEVELRALPQPDGTVPTIIALGPVDGQGLVIKCCSSWRPNCKCVQVIEGPLAPGEVFRPLYITVAGAKREALDAVEVEYTIRDASGTVIQKGIVLLEGAVSGIGQKENSEQAQYIKIGSVIPNPVTETATVALWAQNSVAGAVLQLYDALGRHVTTLWNDGYLAAGTTALTINVAELPNGVYTLVLRTPTDVVTKRFVVAR